MNAPIATILLLAIGIVAVIIWGYALAKWDGKCHCNPEDCKNCPYEGTGCAPEPDTPKSNKGEHTP